MPLKYTLMSTLITVMVVFMSPLVDAHPGNTAPDGGHYCWTNCDYWGEVYGERHFHGGGYISPEYDPPIPNIPNFDEDTGNDYSDDSYAMKDDGSVQGSSTYESDFREEDNNDLKTLRNWSIGLLTAGAATAGYLAYTIYKEDR